MNLNSAVNSELGASAGKREIVACRERCHSARKRASYRITRRVKEVDRPHADRHAPSQESRQAQLRFPG